MQQAIRLKHNGWVVIADGNKALFLRNAGDEMFPNLEVFKKEEQDNPASRDQGTDRPGRFNDGPQVHRSAVSETDWHQFEEERFATELAETLYKRAHKGDFSEIVLVAAPAVLGQLRKEMHKEVTDRVVAEISKDLTNHPVDQIEELILQTP